MGFKMINEGFICENCGKSVEKHPEGSARNHCPFCLCSKHLDASFPWDRASICEWIMVPTGIDYKKNKGYMIEHTCQKCSKKIINRIAPDDDFLSWVKKKNRNI
jgi:DNA-directed RNA polymerase subunit RPC12/RpoP